MNKFRYGNRTLYEKDGRYLKYLDGEFTGEDNRNKALSWLYAASPYKLETTRMADGFKGWIRDTTSGNVISECSFFKHGEESDSEVWARVCDWASRYIGILN